MEPASAITRTIAGPVGPAPPGGHDPGHRGGRVGCDGRGVPVHGRPARARPGRPGGGDVPPDDPRRIHLDRAAAVIADLVAGRAPRGAVPPIDLEDRPDWDRRVLGEVRAVGWGETASYGEIARRIGAPRAARAVGGALGRNPVSLLVPCHRVIAADGTIGGLRRRRLGFARVRARAQAHVAAPRGDHRGRSRRRALGPGHRAHRVHADDDRRAGVERELVADLAGQQQLAEELALARRQSDEDAAGIELDRLTSSSPPSIAKRRRSSCIGTYGRLLMNRRSCGRRARRAAFRAVRPGPADRSARLRVPVLAGPCCGAPLCARRCAARRCAVVAVCGAALWACAVVLAPRSSCAAFGRRRATRPAARRARRHGRSGLASGVGRGGRILGRGDAGFVDGRARSARRLGGARDAAAGGGRLVGRVGRRSRQAAPPGPAGAARGRPRVGPAVARALV